MKKTEAMQPTKRSKNKRLSFISLNNLRKGVTKTKDNPRTEEIKKRG
jgi:hypothetical protein